MLVTFIVRLLCCLVLGYFGVWLWCGGFCFLGGGGCFGAVAYGLICASM